MADSDGSRRDPAGLARGLGRRIAAWRPAPGLGAAPGDVLGGPDSFVLYRILGNDLEPRHRRGQTHDNLAFLLAHEPPLAGCEKRWIVNRIAEPDEEARILALLAAHGQPVLRVPFEAEAYARAGWDTSLLPDAGPLAGRQLRSLHGRLSPPVAGAERQRLWLALCRRKNAYAMNNNGTRNLALEDGRERAKWILPWDGNCFVTAAAWEAIRAAVAARPDLRYFTVPMARMRNAELRDGAVPASPAEEPQILMRRDAAERFDPGFVYGRRPKVELFWRLGVPGEWDRWRDDPWDPPRRPRAADAGRVGTAGWVARLESGRDDLEREDRAGFLERGQARRDAILATLDRLDAALPPPDPDPAGLVCYRSAALAALREGAAPGLAAAILAGAGEALGRGPFSVVHKTSLPPSGDAHDYWHPAPYWWPNPILPGGRPYLRRDGRRVPGTRLYEPDSDRYDRTRLQRLFDDTTTLALASEISGRAEFAAHAAGHVRAWFADPATRMTPHLRYAQVRMGWNRDEGVGTGIIELKDLYYFLDAVRLLDRGGALDDDTRAGLHDWLTAYLAWLAGSRPGARERARHNNHGTYYDLQTAAIAAWLGDRDALRESLVRAQARLPRQFTAAGEQPEELRRATTAHYCLFNLQGWLNLVRLGRRTGVLRPDFAAEPWSRLAAAVAWVLGHDLARWPHRQIGGFDPERGLPLAAHALDIGIADLGPAGAALRGRCFADDKPVFTPHDGIPPYWALAAAPEVLPARAAAAVS